jgi:hypothetical protein
MISRVLSLCGTVIWWPHTPSSCPDPPSESRASRKLFRVARYSPTICRHDATRHIVTNLTAHTPDALPRRFSQSAVFDARLYIRVRRIDEPV